MDGIRNWLITGASAGLGAAFVRDAAAHGDRVAATSRSAASLLPLVDEFGELVVPVELDLTDRRAVRAAVDAAIGELGSLDVVVNNAGYVQSGRVEELNEEEWRAQFDVNFFGALWVTQAALPHFRRQRSGYFVQLSSIGGIAAFPGTSAYNASKWALEAMSEALAAEVAPFGIRVTIIEPGPFRTRWATESHRFAAPIIEYTERFGDQREQRAATSGTEPGDPAAAAATLRRLVQANDPPLRILFGAAANELAPRAYRARIDTWAEWEAVGRSADGAE